MQSLLLMSMTLCIADKLTENMRWVDHSALGDQDIYFDRVVGVGFDGEDQFRASGILLSKWLVLTTFNPFREFLATGRGNMKKIKIISIENRTILDGRGNVSYTHRVSRIACGRQVLPTEDADNVWHMNQGEQSPLHDLMVFKLDKILEPRNKNDSKMYAEFDFTENATAVAGPIVSHLAAGRARLGDDLKFASYGHLDRSHVDNGTKLRSSEFEHDDHVQTDCEEWLPRAWGHFICLSNLQNFPALASGAVLVHKRLVYGLGSFYLEKGEEKSILVFTDLRPYLNLIYRTCRNTEKLP